MATKVTDNAERKCELCKVTVGGQANLEQHLAGRKHAYMVAKSNKNNVDDCGTVTERMADMTTTTTGTRCNICKINVFTEKNLEQHLNGRRHAYMVSQTLVKEKAEELGPALKVECFPGISDFDSQVIHFMVQHEIPNNVRYAKCMKLCGDVDAHLQSMYPRGHATAFGSVITGLASQESDIDLYYDADFQRTSNLLFINEMPRSAEQRMVKSVRKIFGSLFPTFQSVISIPGAKVALVKFYHQPTQVNVDLSFKNGIGVSNTALIQFYLSLDLRIKPLMMVLKHWGRVYELTGTGHITNYALVWMVLFYLQQLQEPVVPTVAALQGGNCCQRYINGWDCSFSNAIASQWQSKNQSSVQELLEGFFRFYAHFNYELYVICPLLGCLVAKNIFYHMENLPLEMKTLKEKLRKGQSEGLKIASKFCIQDPFVLEHNLTVSMSKNLIEKFQMLCSAAERICSSSQQLKVLFENCVSADKSKPNYSEIAIMSSKKFADVLVEVPLECSEEDLKNLWYNTVYESLIDIFENVLKFDVCDITSDSEGTEPKVRKLDSHCDVSSSSTNDFCKMRLLECSAFFCVWDVRKAATKDYYGSRADPSNDVQRMNAIEQQKAITNFTMKNFSQYFGMEQPDLNGSVLSFTCKFISKQNPIHVVLKFSCDARDNVIFASMMMFLKKHLPKWIQEY